MNAREPPENFSRAALLFDLLVGVVQRHEPEVAAVLREERTTAGMPAALLARTLQAQGIWFQLLAIAEQNRDMRSRRELERERGYEHLRGTFAELFASAAAEGITGGQIREAFSGLRVRPVITAHPTEAKRVTVMERHRRIYLRLLDLESPRWTERERQELFRSLGDEIELLWLTGELKLEKPTVAQEVAWGLYFFNEILFDVVPQLFAKVESAFVRQFPAERFEVPLFFQFGSWIGGDRDGNPYVTSEVTRRTLWRDPPGQPAPLPGPPARAGAHLEHRGARARLAGLVPRGGRTGAAGDTGRGGAGGAQPRGDIPPVPRLHALAHRITPSAAPSANSRRRKARATATPTGCWMTST